jgi:hypothetical protein
VNQEQTMANSPSWIGAAEIDQGGHVASKGGGGPPVHGSKANYPTRLKIEREDKA